MTSFKTPATAFATFTLGTCLLSLAPLSEAQACGGTFCDQGPMAMPVDQTGENILFHLTDTTVEAHIQIQIDSSTDAEQFAWVIPVTALPEFEVGSQILFDNLLQSTVPAYGITTSNEFCGEDEGDSFTSSGGDGDPAGDGDWTGGDGDEDSAPEVVFEGSVGAFEIAVLDGGTIEGVMTWLGDNGYQQDPAAEPILAQYLEEEFLFVALKLGVETGVDEVHPVVIRYEGNEPCVPIRLTRIAASDDMEIRTFFLGEARVAPTNYRHVLVNPLKLDWFNNADNYKEVISLAVDADEANGNAFVTEYAGNSNIVSLGGLYYAGWNPDFFRDLVDSPVGAIAALRFDQELLYCDPDGCIGLHPLIEPILAEFIPVPEGVSQWEFYDCLECYAGLIDLDAWDANAFANTLEERIVTPGQHALNLVQDNSYLTRMYTTISPNEMNADPIFAANTTLPNVDLRASFASRFNSCDNSTTVTLPDGREVYFGPGTPRVWPDFQTEMPWEEDVEQQGMADNAPLMSLIDNTELIDTLLAEYNQSQMGGGGEGGGEEGGSEGGNEGSTSGEAGLDESGSSSGCGCTAEDDQGQPTGALALGLLALCGLVRRRR